MNTSETYSGFWSDYPREIFLLLYSLRTIRNHPECRPHPEDPSRTTVDPASVCALQNGLELYAAIDPRFIRFSDHFEAHCKTLHTEPATFDAPIYDELLTFIEDEERQNPKAEQASGGNGG
jgi:hypothetical protein